MARLYLDEQVSVRLRDQPRYGGHDCADAKEMGHRRGARWTDAAHILHAAHERRTLVTANRDDFVNLHDAWRR